MGHQGTHGFSAFRPPIFFIGTVREPLGSLPLLLHNMENMEPCPILLSDLFPTLDEYPLYSSFELFEDDDAPSSPSLPPSCVVKEEQEEHNLLVRHNMETKVGLYRAVVTPSTTRRKPPKRARKNTDITFVPSDTPVCVFVDRTNKPLPLPSGDGFPVVVLRRDHMNVIARLGGGKTRRARYLYVNFKGHVPAQIDLLLASFAEDTVDEVLEENIPFCEMGKQGIYGIRHRINVSAIGPHLCGRSEICKFILRCRFYAAGDMDFPFFVEWWKCIRRKKM